MQNKISNSSPWKHINFAETNPENLEIKNELAEEKLDYQELNNLVREYPIGSSIIVWPKNEKGTIDSHKKNRGRFWKLKITGYNFEANTVSLVDREANIETTIELASIQEVAKNGLPIPVNPKVSQVCEIIKERFIKTDLPKEGILKGNSAYIPYKINGNRFEIDNVSYSPEDFLQIIITNNITKLDIRNPEDYKSTPTAYSDPYKRQLKGISIMNLYTMFTEYLINTYNEKRKEKEEREAALAAQKLLSITNPGSKAHGKANAKVASIQSQAISNWKKEMFDLISAEDIVAWLDGKNSNKGGILILNQSRFDNRFDNYMIARAALLSYIAKRGTVVVNNNKEYKNDYWYRLLGIEKTAKRLEEQGLDDDSEVLVRALRLHLSDFGEEFINQVESAFSNGSKERTSKMNQLIAIGDNDVKSWRNIFWTLGLNDKPQEFFADPGQYKNFNKRTEVPNKHVLKSMSLNQIYERMKGGSSDATIDTSMIDPVEFWTNICKSPIPPSDKVAIGLLFVLGSYDKNMNSVITKTESGKIREKVREYGFPLLACMFDKDREALYRLMTTGAKELNINSIDQLYELLYIRDPELKLLTWQHKVSEQTRKDMQKYIKAHQDMFNPDSKSREISMAIMAKYQHEAVHIGLLSDQEYMDLHLRGGTVDAKSAYFCSSPEIVEKNFRFFIDQLDDLQYVIKNSKDKKQVEAAQKTIDNFSKLLCERIMVLDSPSVISRIPQNVDTFNAMRLRGVDYTPLINHLSSSNTILSLKTGLRASTEKITQDVNEVISILRTGKTPVQNKIVDIRKSTQETLNPKSIIQEEDESEEPQLQRIA